VTNEGVTARLDASKLDRISLLFEDDDLLIVDKPAGIAVHAGADTKRGVVEILESVYEPKRTLHPVHRLDKGTTGVLLIAKHKASAHALTESWDQSRKIYGVIALGRIERPMAITTPLEDKAGIGRTARTELFCGPVLDDLDPVVSFVAVHIETGRMHQIRRHLKEQGHPVLLDDKYGDFRANRGFLGAAKRLGANLKKNLMLHAASLSVPHPRTGALLSAQSPLPEAWQALLGERTAPAIDLLREVQ